MSSVDPFSKGSTLLTYRLGERITTSVWQAEDTRSGKKVAIKILSRQLPKDPGKRDALVRDVRQGAALYHSSLIHIQEIAPAGESLLLVMEWFEGHPIAGRVRGNPVDRKTFFRIAYQIGDALKLLHGKGVTHGNVAGDSILINASGQSKLAGFNISNLLTRQGQLSAFGQKGNDARAVAYMSPEQIANAGITIQTDVFSLGLVLFEAAAGRLPYQAPTAGEIARKIVDDPLPNPKSFNPNIDTAVLSVMGKCLFKDPLRRYKDARAMLEDIAKVDPETAKFAAELAKGGLSLAGTGQGQTETRTSILLLADVANYALLMNTDQPSAAKATARMQQILGEAVYLFDGEVIDPFGPRLVAELKTVEGAIEAGRKGEFDFSPEQQGANPIPVRFLIHAGELEVRDGKAGGAGVVKGFEVLQSVPPLKLHITEEFLKKGRPSLRLRDSGARAGVKLYTIVEPEPQPVAETQIDEEAEEAAAAEEEAAALAAAAGAKKKRQTMMIAAAAGLVLLLGGGAAVVFLRSKPTQTVAPVVQSKAVVPTSTEPAPATAATPRKILLEPFTVEGTDPALGVRANAVRLASIETLRAFPEVSIVDGPAPDATAFTATVRTGTAGPEIVTTSTATPMIDAASGIQTVVQQVASQLNLPQRSGSTAKAYNAFADAVIANAANDAKKTDASLRATIKADPTFMPANLMAMRFFSAQGKEIDAIAAARQVVAADPGNLEAVRMVARFSLKSGDLASTFANFALVLRKEPADAEALNVLGRYAYSAYDIDKFRAVLKRLASLPPAAASIHEPDLILATGRIDTAVGSYYAVEETVKDNPALALKIGRIAVMRHSTPIAEIEFKRLQETDPNYGLHILKAYLAASAGVRTDAESELQAALAASRPGDDYFTNVAEINVISGNSAAVLPALQRAVERKEPTVSYILSNPLFQFLLTDPEYQKLRQKMVEQQQEIRTALAGIPL